MATKVQKSVVQLVVEGRGAETSLGSLGGAVQKLTKEFKELKEADNPKLYAEKLEELKKVREEYVRQKTVVGTLKDEMQKYQAQQKEINKAVKSGGGLFSSLTGGMTASVFAGNMLTKAFDAVTSTLPQLIGKTASLSDELADVQKQTGIAGDELLSLNEQLGEINTRTPIEQMRAFAEVAGKQGFQTSEDVLAFVRAADIISVALVKDLGGNIEEAINDIGKITKIFGLEQEFGIEKSMLMVASAINAVGASSEANEGYMVNWTKRFAGVAPNAKISIADTLGLAAAMDIAGQTSELSATNIGKMVIAMGKDVPYFAKVAGMEVKKFSQLLQTDGNEAFLRVLEGAKSSTKGVEGLAKTLAVMGIEGSEGAQILGVLTNNIDMVREQQALANAELEKGTSVVDEFNVKNQNTAAILDKIGKVLEQWKAAAANLISPLIEKFGLFIGVVSELDIELNKFTEQQKRVAGLESTLNPLISRYEKLKEKTSLSADEQTELRKIIVRIGEILPNSVTKFDQYGNAIDISTTKAKEAIEVQKQLLKTLNAEAIKQVESDIRRAELTKKNMRKLLEDNSGVVEYRGREGYVRVQRSNERTAEIVKTYKDANKEIEQLLQKRKELSGEFDFKVSPPPSDPSPKDPKPPGGDGTSKADYDKQKVEAKKAMDQEEKASEQLAKKKADDVARLREQISKEQQEITLSQMGEYEKEIVATALHYDKMREEAQGNSDDIAQINELQRLKIQEINDKYDQKFTKDKEDFIKKIHDLTLGQEGNEIAAINEKYDLMIADAERFGLSTIEIEKARLDALEKVRAAASDKERQKAVDDYNFKLANAEAEGRNTLPIVRERLDQVTQLIEQAKDKESQSYKDLVKEKNDLLQNERQIAAAQANDIIMTFGAAGDALSDILTLAAGNQSEYAEFQKALAIFKIAIETAAAVSSAIAASTPGDPYSTAVRIATAVATVTAGFVKVKALMKEAKEPKTPTFGDGGFTDMAMLTPHTTGYIDRATLYEAPGRRFIAGEKGREFIFGARVLQHPAVAAYTRMIDAIQKTRNFGALDQIGSAGGGAAANNAELIQEFRAMRQEFKALMQNEAKRPVDFNIDKFNRINDFYISVKDDSAA